MTTAHVSNPTTRQRSAARGKVLALAGAAALAAFSWGAVGCGSSGGITSGASTSSGSGSNTLGATFVPIQARVPSGTPGSAARPTDWVMAALQSVSSPAEAAGIASLPFATVKVYNGQGAEIVTGTTDASGNATFSLFPGTYLFRVSKGGVTLLRTATVSSSGVTLVIDATSTAVAMMVLSQAGGTAIAGADIAAFEAIAASSSPAYQQLLTSVDSAVTNGTSFVDPNTVQITDTNLQTSASTLGSGIFAVVQRYPAVDQLGVFRRGPIAVAFNKAINQSEIPPTFTGWTVTHNIVSTGQAITINPSNMAQYGSWSYSDSPTTVNGVALPAHCLVFSLTSQSMAANAKEVFTWSFNALPHAADNTVLTLGGPDQVNLINNLTFYTGTTL